MEFVKKNKWVIVAIVAAIAIYAEVKHKTLTKWKDKLFGPVVPGAGA